MTNSTYRIVLGGVLLLALYFGVDEVIYALVAMTLLEGLTGWTAPMVQSRIMGAPQLPADDSCEVACDDLNWREIFGAERAWRFVVGGILLTTFSFPNSAVWFFPWFMGFALIGAGVSSVCPMLVAIRWLGFK